jgi:hypothetical protein
MCNVSSPRFEMLPQQYHKPSALPEGLQHHYIKVLLACYSLEQRKRTYASFLFAKDDELSFGSVSIKFYKTPSAYSKCSKFI